MDPLILGDDVKMHMEADHLILTVGRIGSDGIPDFYSIFIREQSARALLKALGRPFAVWEIRDHSLRVVADEERLSLRLQRDYEPGVLEVHCSPDKRNALAGYLTVFLDRGEACRSCGCSPPRTEIRDLRDAEIVVERADEDSAVAAGFSPGTEAFILTIDGEPLATPFGHVIVCSDRRALDSLASELEYSGVLDLGGVTTYGLLATSLDYALTPVDLWDDLRTRDSVIHDPLLRTSADHDLASLMKYMQPLTDYLSRREISFPFAYTEPSPGEPLFAGPAVDRAIELVQSEVRLFDEVRLAAFSTANRAFGSPMMAKSGWYCVATNRAPSESRSSSTAPITTNCQPSRVPTCATASTKALLAAMTSRSPSKPSTSAPVWAMSERTAP